jgi:hypothetical protein
MGPGRNDRCRDAGSIWLMKKERGGNLWAVKAISRESVERKGIENPDFSEVLLALIRLKGVSLWSNSIQYGVNGNQNT